jgi:hypothetical protein
MNTEWADLIADVRASVQSFEEWPKDRGIGPVCPVHGSRHMKRVASYTYRCTLDPDTTRVDRDFHLSLDPVEGIQMIPTSRIAGVNP